jgi:hypothetical protein
VKEIIPLFMTIFLLTKSYFWGSCSTMWWKCCSNWRKR